jgi:uncharacterized membrane protein YgcG
MISPKAYGSAKRMSGRLRARSRRLVVLMLGVVSVVGLVWVVPASFIAAGAAGAAGAPTTPTARSNFSTASGTVAAVVGTDTLEVQNPSSGQVAVTITPSTVITQSLPASLSSLASGECVSATGTAAKSGTVTARTVTITQPVSSACTGIGGFGGAGFGGAAGGGGGFRGGFGGGGRTPSSFPARSRTGAANFGSASGELLSISGSKLKVKGTEIIPPKASKSSSKGSTTTLKAGSVRPKLKTKTVTKIVKVTSTTTFSKIVSATSSAVATNQCVTAIGPANDQGAITATRLSISSPGPSGCSSGFGGFGGVGGSFGGGGGSRGTAGA